MQRLQVNPPSECGFISLLINLALSFFHFSRTTVLTTSENTITYHNTLCWSLQNFAILHKHCLQFLLGVKMAREKLKTMLMQNFGVTNKEYYGMLWYLLERSICN